MGVDLLEDLATDAEDEDAAQLLYNYRALRSTIEVRRFRRALQDLRISTEQGGGAVGPTPTPALPLKPHLGSPTSILSLPGSPMDPPTPSPSFLQVLKLTKEATPLDKGDLQLDSLSEVTENNNNARIDHGDEKLSHPQVFKAAKDATPPDKGKLDLDFRTEVMKTNTTHAATRRWRSGA